MKSPKHDLSTDVRHIDAAIAGDQDVAVTAPIVPSRHTLNEVRRPVAHAYKTLENGLLEIHPSDNFTRHPLALQFRRLPRQTARVSCSLDEHGQLTPIDVLMGDDGVAIIINGNTRTDLLHAKGKCVIARIRVPADFSEETPEEWIRRSNMEGSEGRSHNDQERAIQFAELNADQIAKYRDKSDAQSKRGKALKPEEKSDPIAQSLARKANVSVSCMKQTLLFLSKPHVTPELVTAVFNGEVAISKALTILALEDGAVRMTAIEAAIKGDKKGLKQILALAAGSKKRLAPGIPASLAPEFAKAVTVEKLAKKVEKLRNDLSLAGVDECHLGALATIQAAIVGDLADSMCDVCDQKGHMADGSPCATCTGRRFLTIGQRLSLKKATG